MGLDATRGEANPPRYRVGSCVVSLASKWTVALYLIVVSTLAWGLAPAIDDETIAAFSRRSGAQQRARAEPARARSDGVAQVERPTLLASVQRSLSAGALLDGRSAGASARAARSSGGPQQCLLYAPDARRAASDCTSCHPLNRSHPVDVDYAAAAAATPGLYRSVGEAVRRGVFLPDGQIKCATCHDPQSPWKYKIALPPGTIPSVAVEEMTPQQLEAPVRMAATTPPRAGSAVTPTPLCLSCHALD